MMPTNRAAYMRDYMRKRRASSTRLTSLSDADKAEIKRLYLEEKMGTDTIGDRFGRDGSTICYWLEKMGIRRRAANGRSPTCWTRKHTLGFAGGEASKAAATFYQPTLINFMPDSPRLEMEWRHVLAEVRAERGAQWTELQGVTR